MLLLKPQASSSLSEVQLNFPIYSSSYETDT